MFGPYKKHPPALTLLYGKQIHAKAAVNIEKGKRHYSVESHLKSLTCPLTIIFESISKEKNQLSVPLHPIKLPINLT